MQEYPLLHWLEHLQSSCTSSENLSSWPRLDVIYGREGRHSPPCPLPACCIRSATTIWATARSLVAHLVVCLCSLIFHAAWNFSAILSRRADGQPSPRQQPQHENIVNARQFECEMSPGLKETKQVCSSPTTTWLPWARARPRVVTIYLDTDGSLSPATEYHDASVLHAYLLENTCSDALCRRSIYILEALSPEFITFFESYFQLHPNFFKDHERHVALYNRATGEAVGVPLLPSANYGRNYVSLKYHEPLLMNPLPTGFQNLCDVSGRHVAVTKVIGKFSEVGIARRKCTLWSRENDHGGWDCKPSSSILRRRLAQLIHQASSYATLR